MFKFIKIQFRLGKMTAAQVKECVTLKRITDEQAHEILGDAYDETEEAVKNDG